MDPNFAQELSATERDILQQVRDYTMTSPERIVALVRAVQYLCRNQIPGDFVECGVWRGGSMMAAALTLLAEQDTSRRLFLFDTYEGMTEPTERDKDLHGKPAADTLRQSPPKTGFWWCYASLEDVQNNVQRTGYPMDKVHLIKGPVEQTLRCSEVSRLALLRLDTDWYESTLHELQHLFPLLVVGGVLIIDDYGHWQGAREATDEYFARHPEFPVLLNRIDYSGKIAVKILRPPTVPPSALPSGVARPAIGTGTGPTVIIISADAAYFEHARRAILSIHQRRPAEANVAIGFLDVGCTEEQLAWIRQHVELVKAAEWEFDFPQRTGTPGYMKGLLARPFLRKYFPGYEVYFWLDADAWILDWDAVEWYIRGARRRGLAITPQMDRSFGYHFGGWRQAWQNMWKIYRQWFGDELANKYSHYPVLNAGVFALRHDAPHWDAWANALVQAASKGVTILTDQSVLNIATFQDPKLFQQTELLPAPCNWTWHAGRPAWDEQAQRLVEPYLPHAPIGIIHRTLASRGKTRLSRVSTTTGGNVTLELYHPTGPRLHSPAPQPPESSVSLPPDPRANVPTRPETPRTDRNALTPVSSTSPSPTEPIATEWDYVSPGLLPVQPDRAFPFRVVGDKGQCKWRYLRRAVPHHWYVDRRAPHIGFLNRDESHVLYNLALQFKGKRALEIGCWLGWSACHLALAGVTLDVIDPVLAKPGFSRSVVKSLTAAGVLHGVNLLAASSPQAVEELATQHRRKWALIFIDGNHEAHGPLEDARVCERYAESDAAILFHDLASPDVAAGLNYLRDRGWQTLVYQTMQIMGMAWRGSVTPVSHIPDPAVAWTLPAHLQGYTVASGRRGGNPA